MSDQKAVKKVRPYPISAELTVGAAAIHGNIVKLARQGFLIELDKLALKVGDEHAVKFVLPLSSIEIAEPVVVIKTYDEYRGHELRAKAANILTAASNAETETLQPDSDSSQEKDTPKANYFLAELHFTQLQIKNLTYIRQFLFKIGQR